MTILNVLTNIPSIATTLSSRTSSVDSLRLQSIESRTGEVSLPISELTRKLILDCEPLGTANGEFLDSKGRLVTLKGINVDAMMKLPTKPYLKSCEGDCEDPQNIFFEGDTVSFVGRPFPLEEAEHHIARIKLWGYNTIRYLLTWEAVEHEGPGKYDQDFIDYTVEVLKIIHDVGGIYVLLEFHQDVWLRFLGGSGAPLWTFYAAGLEPKRFAVTEAAILHNQRKFKKEPYPKMLWVSNYNRLASFVMFTLFFSGDIYFPDLRINHQNIKEYLQTTFFNMEKFIWRQLTLKLPDMVKDGTLLGFELMNEPNCGLVGRENLAEFPDAIHLRVDATPSPFQTIKLGLGIACELDLYKISVTGPLKQGTRIVNPKGQLAWQSETERLATDKKYGWIRENWPAGCIFKNQGIWDPETSKLLIPNYFLRPPTLDEPVDFTYFANNQFKDFYARHKKVVRDECKDAFVFIQSPVLEVPPKFINLGLVDLKTVYCPHYYDGMSLMFKTWNTKYNVDTLGIMRGKYVNPVLGLVVGERSIRNCIRDQFQEIRTECDTNIGHIPILMLETGMPFDMNDKAAYKVGRYYPQTGGLDALLWALEGAQLNHTYWTYCLQNQHQLGDCWNNEDFSFWLPEDRSETGVYNVETTKRLRLKDSLNSVKRGSSVRKYSRSDLTWGPLVTETSRNSFEATTDGEETDVASLQPSLGATLSSLPCSLIRATHQNLRNNHLEKCFPSPDGVRAASAVIRPYAIAYRGEKVLLHFDLKRVTFKLTVKLTTDDLDDDTPTVIYVPKWHYPYLDARDVSVTSGRVEYNEFLQCIEWFHQDTPENFVSEALIKQESIVIKNLSGTVDQENPALFPCGGELSCPIS